MFLVLVLEPKGKSRETDKIKLVAENDVAAVAAVAGE